MLEHIQIQLLIINRFISLIVIFMLLQMKLRIKKSHEENKVNNYQIVVH